MIDLRLCLVSQFTLPTKILSGLYRSCIGENLLDEPLPSFCLATSLATCVLYTIQVWWPEAEVTECKLFTSEYSN